jgi:hypothetical protein
MLRLGPGLHQTHATQRRAIPSKLVQGHLSAVDACQSIRRGKHELPGARCYCAIGSAGPCVSDHRDRVSHMQRARSSRGLVVTDADDRCCSRTWPPRQPRQRRIPPRARMQVSVRPLRSTCSSPISRLQREISELERSRHRIAYSPHPVCRRSRRRAPIAPRAKRSSCE